MIFSNNALSDKTILITGASSGLGAHFAKVAVAGGGRVVLAARRIERLEELASDLRRRGAAACAVAMDVTERDSVASGFDALEAEFGPADVVVCNAGVPSGARFTEMSEDEWRSVLDVNLDGVFRVGQEGAQRLRRAAKSGSIINIASILGSMVLRSLSAYAVSKAGVVQLTKAMALELARDDIRVNAIAPGYISSEMNEAFLKSEAGQKLLAKVPMPRAGDLRELDGPFLLLASDASSYMTGSVVTVDGGSLLSLR